jgi:hypothetical protein
MSITVLFLRVRDNTGEKVKIDNIEEKKYYKIIYLFPSALYENSNYLLQKNMSICKQTQIFSEVYWIQFESTARRPNNSRRTHIIHWRLKKIYVIPSMRLKFVISILK